MKKWKVVKDKFVKNLRQQTKKTTGQPALKKKAVYTLIGCSFCCVLLAMENTFSNEKHLSTKSKVDFF